MGWGEVLLLASVNTLQMQIHACQTALHRGAIYFQCDRRCDSSFSQVISQPLQPFRWILMACGPLESTHLAVSACSSSKLHPEGASTPSAGDTACTAPHAPTGQLLSPAHKGNTRMCNA